MIPDFVGDLLEIITWDSSAHLWTQDNWEFTLAGDLIVTTSDGSVSTLDTGVVVADGAPAPLPAVLEPFVGATIREVLVSPSGDLGVTTDAGQLAVRAASDYEAWQVAGPDGEMLICTPGGRLAHFPARA